MVLVAKFVDVLYTQITTGGRIPMKVWVDLTVVSEPYLRESKLYPKLSRVLMSLC